MLEHRQATPKKPHRVVVLGASGFVARDLVRHLQNEGIPHRAIGSGEVDLLKPESVAQLEASLGEDDSLVITSCITPDKGKDAATLMKNLTMAQHVCLALEKIRCAHIVYVSSDAVYGWRESLIRESSVREANDLYGIMHLAREKMLSLAAAHSNTPLCIFCPSAIYGPGDTHNSYGPNRFLRSAIKDRIITLFGGGEETRDHVYIEDVSQLLTLCLQHRSAGTINAATGRAVSFREVAAMVANRAGDEVKIEKLLRSGPITHRHFDVTERIKAFPSFGPTSLENGLDSTFLQLTQQRRG